MTPDFIIGTLIPNYLGACMAIAGVVVAIISLRTARRSSIEAKAAAGDALALQEQELQLRTATADAVRRLSAQVETLELWRATQPQPTTSSDSPVLIQIPTISKSRATPTPDIVWDAETTSYLPAKTYIDLGLGEQASGGYAGVRISPLIADLANQIEFPDSSGSRYPRASAE